MNYTRELIEDYRRYLIRRASEVIKDKEKCNKMLESLKLSVTGMDLEKLDIEIDYIIDEELGNEDS